MDQTHQSAGQIVADLLLLDDDARRNALERACAGDAALRAAVEDLLDTRQQRAAAAPLDARIGSLVGPYRLLAQIGEGGFGTVFLAEQREPVVRRVALKIIKLGMDTRQVIARFEAERQVLALMDHPNIARVLDAGATVEGRPYFVMELVHGEPITHYCDRNVVGIERRLDLFVQVCLAVQHAHQKGIVHRDIKPSNVLVTMVDGKPVPKVIDFGIAKATTLPLTDRTLFTELHEAIGTPEYMSPEQAEMTGVDIDTRADIYSLGVLLYELLTGTTPFESRQLRAAGFAEMQRIIREVDPPMPSSRLTEHSHTLTDVAKRRHVDPAKLPAAIRGDLDWIVMRCLEKDRTRRYESAGGLVMDIAHHLAGEPVTAAPPNRAYRLRKFVSRNRAAVLTAAAIALLLVAGIGGTTWGFVRAETRQREAEAQRREAEVQKDTADQVLRVFQEMLEGVQAQVAQGRDTALLKEILDRTRQRIDQGEFEARPLVELPLRNVIGLTYLDLNDFDSALSVLNGALRLARERDLGTSPAAVEALNSMGGALGEAGRDAEAEQFFHEALQIRRRTVKGDDDLTSSVLNSLAATVEILGRPAEAEPMHREALAMKRRLHPGDDPGVAMSITNLAYLLQRTGRLTEAEPLYREALAMRQRLYRGKHPLISVTMNNLAILLALMGRGGEAEQLYRDSLAIRRELYHGDHESVATGIANLASAINAAGRPAEAEAMFREALEMRQRLFKGADHPSIAVNLDNLGVAVRLQGRAAEAEGLARASLAMLQRLFVGDHPDVAFGFDSVALALLAKGDPVAAEPYARNGLAMLRRLFPGDHPWTATSLNTLAQTLIERRRAPDAVSVGREALDMNQRLFTGAHPKTAEALHTLGRALAAAGESKEAMSMLQQSVAMARSTLAPGHSQIRKYEQTLSKLSQVNAPPPPLPH
jgi:eukaryotic-like serine/threonine-protein kinase